MLPVLVIFCACPALISVDGHTAGEADRFSPAVIPVAPSCTLYVEAQPLIAGYCSIVRKLILSEGYASFAYEQESTFLWSQCIQINLQPEKLQKAPKPAATLANTCQAGRKITLFCEGGGVHISVEADDELLYSHTLSQTFCDSGELHISNGVLCAIAKNHCLCLSLEDYSTVLELCGEKLRCEGEFLYCEALLDSRLGHKCSTCYNFTTGTLLSKNTARLRAPQSGQEAMAALPEALKHEEYKEALSYLSGDLSKLDVAALIEFFGRYDNVLLHPFTSDIVGLQEKGNPSIREYSFSFEENDGRFFVTNVQEL